MIEGTFQDGYPRTSLNLPGAAGDFDLEFIVDTGFDGDLALPARYFSRLDVHSIEPSNRVFANGTVEEVVTGFVSLPGYPDRDVEVLLLQGNPLIGNTFLQDQHLHIEMAEGGSVYAEELG